MNTGKTFVFSVSDNQNVHATIFAREKSTDMKKTVATVSVYPQENEISRVQKLILKHLRLVPCLPQDIART